MVALGIAGYCLAIGANAAALAAIVLVVLMMETRVRMGVRNVRGIFFVLHVVSGALLLGALATLTFYLQLPWLHGASALLLLLVAVSGMVLLTRSLKLQ